MSKPQGEVLRGVAFGDPHVTVNPPGWRTPETWGAEFESLMAQVLTLATQVRADFVACPGDWFHSKASSSHADVLRVIRATAPIVDKFGPILTIPGNHDMVGHNVADASKRQPIAVLEAAGVIQRVDLAPKVFRKGTETFAVGGAPYSPGPPTRLGSGLPRSISGAVVLLHHDFYVGGQEPSASRLLLSDDWFRKAEEHQAFVLVNGHIHDDVGVMEHPKLPRVFVNVGALARISTAEADLVPQALALTLRRGRAYAKLVSLEVEPADRAYLPEAAGVKGGDPSLELEEFLRYLGDEDESDGRSLETLLRSYAAERGDPGGALEAAAEVLASVPAR